MRGPLEHPPNQMTSWTNECQAIRAIGSLAVSIIGFAVLLYQLRQLRRSMQTDTHSKLYTNHKTAMARIYLDTLQSAHHSPNSHRLKCFFQ